MNRVLKLAIALWFTALPALAQEQVCPPDGKPRPIMRTHLLPPMPDVAAPFRGTTLLEVFIAADGHVTSSRAVESSGSALLDQTAVDWVRDRWLWQPYTGCQPGPVSTRISILWHVPVPKPAP